MSNISKEESEQIVTDWLRNTSERAAANKPAFVATSAAELATHVRLIAASADRVELSGRDVRISSTDGSAVVYSVPEIASTRADMTLASIIREPNAEDLLLQTIKAIAT